MAEKVLIPNRGVVALDIIYSLSSIGLETILMYSPEDAHSLPVKLADQSFKFFSSYLEDSYLDMEAIIEKALELKVDYIHPGYGFLAEKSEFAKLCHQNNVNFIGPDYEILKIIENKVDLKLLAQKLGIKILKHTDAISSPLDIESAIKNFNFPIGYFDLRRTYNFYGFIFFEI